MKRRIATCLGVFGTLVLLTSCNGAHKADAAQSSESTLGDDGTVTPDDAQQLTPTPVQKPVPQAVYPDDDLLSNPTVIQATPEKWTNETPFSGVRELLPLHTESNNPVQVGEVTTGRLLTNGSGNEVIVTEPSASKMTVYSNCPQCQQVAVFPNLENPVSVSIVPCGTNRENGVLIGERGSPNREFPNGRITCMEQYEPGKFSARILADKLDGLSAVKTGDFNGDGCLDFIAATNPDLAWYKNDCSGNYTKNTIENDSYAFFLDCGDLDNDSYTDCVTMTLDGKVNRLINTGNGTFFKDTLFPGHDLCAGPSSIKIYDAYGDGRKAILKTNGLVFDQYDNMTDHGLRVGSNSPWGFYKLQLGDCNAFDARKRHGLFIFESDGHNGFNKERKLADLHGATSIAITDVNGDKHKDIVVGGSRNPFADPNDVNPHVLVWVEHTSDSKFVPHMLGWPGNSAYMVTPASFGEGDDVGVLISSYEGLGHEANNCYLGHLTLKD